MDNEEQIRKNDRKRRGNIFRDESVIFDIEDNPNADPSKPSYAYEDLGIAAVQRHRNIIEEEAKQQGVSSDLVKSIMFLENSQGGIYGNFFEAIGASDNISGEIIRQMPLVNKKQLQVFLYHKLPAL